MSLPWLGLLFSQQRFLPPVHPNELSSSLLQWGPSNVFGTMGSSQINGCHWGQEQRAWTSDLAFWLVTSRPDQPFRIALVLQRLMRGQWLEKKVLEWMEFCPGLLPYLIFWWAPVTEVMQHWVWDSWDEAKFIEPLITWSHSRFGYYFSEACFCDFFFWSTGARTQGLIFSRQESVT
jgi:hypothetical protein